MAPRKHLSQLGWSCATFSTEWKRHLMTKPKEFTGKSSSHSWTSKCKWNEIHVPLEFEVGFEVVEVMHIVHKLSVSELPLTIIQNCSSVDWLWMAAVHYWMEKDMSRWWWMARSEASLARWNTPSFPSSPQITTLNSRNGPTSFVSCPQLILDKSTG